MNEQQDDWHGFWIGQQASLNLWVTHLNGEGLPEEGCHLFRAEAVVPGFKALFEFSSQLAVFKVFENHVRGMYDALKGTAHFESTESNVVVNATMDRFGHVFWQVRLRSQHGDSPELTFGIEEDQTLLWNVAAKIEDMLETLDPRLRGAQNPR